MLSKSSGENMDHLLYRKMLEIFILAIQRSGITTDYHQQPQQDYQLHCYSYLIDIIDPEQFVSSTHLEYSDMEHQLPQPVYFLNHERHCLTIYYILNSLAPIIHNMIKYNDGNNINIDGKDNWLSFA